MSTTLAPESFSDINLRERTELDGDYVPGSSVLLVRSSEGYVPGQIIYVGRLGAEGCERAVIASVPTETTINLTQTLALPHTRYEPVRAVLGDLIKIYRAVNVDGRAPAREFFTVLATRAINADHQSTYYTDSMGDSNFWYTFTYFNPLTNDETELQVEDAVRGDDFGHYASIHEIRIEAGFENAYNLKDTAIDEKRRDAEAEINASLSGAYTVPFTSPVPAIVRTLTKQLAAALLKSSSYGGTAGLKEARDAIKDYRDKTLVLTDEDGTALTSSDSVSGYPGEVTDEAPRFFRMGDRF